jgi:hypothetical protein
MSLSSFILGILLVVVLDTVMYPIAVYFGDPGSAVFVLNVLIAVVALIVLALALAFPRRRNW